MLAVSLTFLAASFILGPELLSRWILGFVVPRRRGEEVTRAIAWALVPLALTILWVRWGHVLAAVGSREELETVASGLYSNNYFDAHRTEFFSSLGVVGGLIWSLLWRLYTVVAIFALLLNIAVIHYRSIRSILPWTWAKSVAATLLLPRVSEWYVLLSDMLLPTSDVCLQVDVLTKTGILYRAACRIA